MARVIMCDFCAEREASGIYSDTQSGTTVSHCMECGPMLLTMLVEAWGLVPQDQAVSEPVEVEQAPAPAPRSKSKTKVGSDTATE